MSNKDKKFNIYNVLVNRTAKKDAVGYLKNEPKNLVTYFKMMWRNFSRLFYMNLIMVLGNFPIFFALLALSGIISDRGLSAQSSLFGNYMGMLNFSDYNPVTAAMFGIHGVQVETVVNTTLTYVAYGLTFLIVLTWGYTNTVVAINMRNIVKCDHVFIVEDSKSTLKKNKFQALVVGIIDLLIIAFIVYDLIFFYINANTGDIFTSICLGIAFVIALLYLMARMYIYPLLVTFKLSTPKLFKNAFIFAMIGIKRNIVAVIGIALIVLINYFLLSVYMPIGIIIPFIITIALIQFTSTYAAWPNIQKIMIDPYYNEDGSEKTGE